ncbi:MAG: hypothetical protein JNN05_01440, partial [Candidatus Omnitrophica bacterium]|nr:hypothetical protein [Candidatus Omnitrophota bacterium]
MWTDKQIFATDFNSKDARMTPPMRRSPIAYRPYSKEDKSFVRSRPCPSKVTLISHRIVFFGLIFVSLMFGGIAISTVFSPEGITRLEAGIIFIFTLLFGWTSTSFWMTIIGFISLMRGPKRITTMPTLPQNVTGIAK